MASKKNYDSPLAATITGITDLFKKQEPAGEIKPTDRLDGKTVLVDGASSGLGFAVAVELARRGAKVIMACRSGIPAKGEEAKKCSGSLDIHMLPVDFSDTDSIYNMVSAFKEKFGKMDVLVCNAGVVPKKSRKTKQGMEEMFMVNYFSKFLFVNLLLEKESFHMNNPRIIFVSSETHRNPKAFDWDSFGIYKDYTIKKSMELYGYYKLLLTTFAVELSRRLNSESLRFNVFALCPGPVNSNIGREAPKIFHPLMKLVFAIFFRSPEKAAKPVIYFATSPDVKEKSFDYLFLMGRRPAGELAADPENGEKLWRLSDELRRKMKI